ncbi:hypothetical protein ACFRSX_30895 [Streptomyces goshikiensis]|uniref:hypothetical protein n=1 Tax=Streptomyces TaxID=1883 RepID=UPI000C275227|nr:hypothetical protein [Streptomyces sp. CB02120-2]PJN14652.1 hypothetical protein CG724_33810 [Streptomyces sp. CB02120-2]
MPRETAYTLVVELERQEGAPVSVSELLHALQDELDGFELYVDTDKGDARFDLTVSGVLTAKGPDKRV